MKAKDRKRRWLRWLWPVVALLVLLGSGHALVLRNLPTIAIHEISRLTNTTIMVESSSISLEGVVEIIGLVVRPMGEASYDNTILRAQSVHATFSKASLFFLRPKLRDITVHDFVLDAQYDLDTGRWNVSDVSINIPKGRGEQMPRIHLEQGTLRYSRVSDQVKELALAIPIDALFELNQMTEKGFKFEIKTAPIAKQLGQSRLDGYWKPGLVTLTGGISSHDTPSLERVWAINAMAAQLTYDPAGDYEFTMSIRRLETSRRIESDTLSLIPRLFGKGNDPVARVQGFLHRYQPTGTVDIRLSAKGNAAKLRGSMVEGWIDCTNVSVLDLKFPYRMDHLAGRIHFSHEGWHTAGLTGQHDNIPLLIRFTRKGTGADREYTVTLSSDKMILNEELYNALSPRNQRLWSLANPSGPVGFQYDHSYSKAEGRHQVLSVTFKGTDATYRGVPYPLQNLTGRATFQGDQIQFSGVRTNGLAHEITVEGRILNQNTESPDYDLTIRATGIPVDDTLRQALPPAFQSVMEDLQLQGTIGASIVITSKLDHLGPHFAGDIYFQGASLVLPYQKLAIGKLRGGPVAIGYRSLEIQDVQGVFGGDPVSMSGTVMWGEDAQLDGYELRVQSPRLSVENARKALGEQVNKSIDWFSPSGDIALDLTLQKPAKQSRLRYQAEVRFLGTAVTPEAFPYPFTDLTGGFTADANTIILRDIVARPMRGDTSRTQAQGLSINGHIDLKQGAMNTAEIRLAAPNWPLDRETLLALPHELSDCLLHLALTGSVLLDPAEIRLVKRPDGTVQFNYDITLHSRDCRFKALGTEGRYTGSIQAIGQYHSKEGLAKGSIAMNAQSLTIKEKTAENMHALISYDPIQRTWKSNDILADFYGGRLLGRLEHQRRADGTTRVGLQLGLSHSDFGQFMALPSEGRSETKPASQGVLNAELSLMLSPGDETARRGRCSFTITDMRVGRAPLLSQLLSALQLTEPSDHQFDSLLVDGYIKGDQLVIDKLDMSGESVAFWGRGHLNLLNENIDLQLIARGKRLAYAEPSLIQSLTEGVVGAVMRVNITGTLSSPRVVPQALPMIEDSLRRLTPPAH